MKNHSLLAFCYRPLVLLALLAPTASAAQCAGWSPEFSTPGVDGRVHVQTNIQQGGGSVFVIGGAFTWVGPHEAKYLAQWDGTTWSSLAPGAPGPVLALAQYDDGTGSAIYAGGDGYFAKWNGVSWNSTQVSGEVKVMHTHDDGNGMALYVGGDFNFVDSMPISNVGRFDGAWSNMSGGVTPGTQNPNADVRSMEIHDDGNGPKLYIGGSFQKASGQTARNLAKWNGVSLSNVGPGIVGGVGFGTSVRALQSYTPPGGTSELHVGGKFSGVAGMNTSRWISWAQSSWNDIGGSETLESFTLRTEQGGTFLYAGRETGVERYDGVSRSSLPYALPSLTTSISAIGTSVPQDLFAGTTLPNESRSHFSLWSGAVWEPLFAGPGVGLGVPDLTGRMTAHDWGQGKNITLMRSTLYAPTNPIIQYDGTAWTTVATNNFIGIATSSVLSHDGDLYAIGNHSDPQGNGQFPVARLVGNSWVRQGPVLPNFTVSARTAVMFDAGNGPQLYLGGYGVGDIGAPGTVALARLVGSTWGTVGGGITGSVPGTVQKTVSKLSVWNDGAGDALYVGGSFTQVGSVAAESIAKWDGAQWSSLGAGIINTTGNQPQVQAIVGFNGPEGDQLIAAGIFNRAGGLNVGSIAAWNGTTWDALGGGLTADGLPAFVLYLLAHDPDGNGERLYAAGNFDSAGGQPSNGFAIWDGVSWDGSPEVDIDIYGLLTHDDGNGRGLYVSGTFTGVAGVGSLHVAKYVDPCGAILGVPQCTSTINSSGQRARTRAYGSASVSDTDITLEASNLPANTFTLLFAGNRTQHAFAGDGILCVSGGLKRLTPGAQSNASGVTTKVFDFNAPYSSLATAGQSLVVQAFFRDLAGGPAGFNTSDAIEIMMRP